MDLQSNPAAPLFSVCSQDVSTSGMFLKTGSCLPQGSLLKLSFRLLRTGFHVLARGEVRYCLPGVGVGVEFKEISDEARKAIAAEAGQN